MKKILIITPRSPFTNAGACEQDRLSGIKWFIRNGYEVDVITKIMPSDAQVTEVARESLKIPITTIPYKFNQKDKLLKRLFRNFKRVINPLYWDGASFEYFDFEIQTAVAREISAFKPDLVWFDYSYLWPLYKLVPNNIPIYTRSINFEPLHFLDEDGKWPWNYLRVIPKFMSEWIVAKKSKVVFAITPKEKRYYQLFGGKTVTLPLRGLPKGGGNDRVESSKIYEIHLGFTASTYNVRHNLKALLFIIKGVLPKLRGGNIHYVFHFTGSKLPDSIKAILTEDDKYEGFVPSMVNFWNSIDIALVPSLFGAGMQQKVFEPLVLGVPTITSKRAITGYSFGPSELVFAKTENDFVREIEILARNPLKRRLLSMQSQIVSKKLFGADAVDAILNSALQ